MRTKPMILALMLLGILGSIHAADYQARVVAVSDGDTLTVLRPDRTQAKIRLFGVDAPETGQDFGGRAKQFTSELAFGKVVSITVHDTDRYGRTVGDVRLPDGRSLNHELVRAGLGWWYRHYAPQDRDLGRLEAEARAAKRGLWVQSNAVPPWEWRQQAREHRHSQPGRVTKGEPRQAPRTGKQESSSGPVVGNRHSHVYHRPTCRAVSAMKPGNKVAFKSAREAESEGFRKAGDCW